MTSAEFTDSLSSEQSAALAEYVNKLLVEFRTTLVDSHVAQIADLSTQFTASEQARDAALKERDTIAGLLADAKAKFLAGDHDGITALIADTDKTAAQKRRDEITAARAALDAEEAALTTP